MKMGIYLFPSSHILSLRRGRIKVGAIIFLIFILSNVKLNLLNKKVKYSNNTSIKAEKG